MRSSIEKLIGEQDWLGARSAIEEELKEDPNDHWLLTRLSLTYYEVGEHAKSLVLNERALTICPECPLALWDYAGSLDMLKRWDDAESVYSQLLSRGLERVASHECGEGTEWTISLFADVEYRRASCFIKLALAAEAQVALDSYKRYLSSGANSIYSIEQTGLLESRINSITRR